MTSPVRGVLYPAAMARNTELVRQWEILREIDAARTGIPIAKLASTRKVHPRTIRRDLDALCKAGFPLFDDKVNGTSMWKLSARPFRGLEEAGLGITEVCALYFGRSLVATASGAPFEEDLNRAFAKLERAMPQSTRRFLDQLPLMIKTKVTGRKKQDDRKAREILTRVMDASMNRRRVEMRYHSHASQRVKDYLVEPLRISYADGGIYLTAWVPEYRELRTFAVERIRTLGVTAESFAPHAMPPEPFANSIGVFSGDPTPVAVAFDASAAGYVASREWHHSQEVVTHADGSIVVHLSVCDDRPLRTWILGFGAAARVLAPAALAIEIRDELDAARARYAPPLTGEALKPERATRQLRMTLPARPARKSSA
jgi:predicted DNA-binding transcriptional regulator YafY